MLLFSSAFGFYGFQEKERQLEVNNIYANRALKTGSNNATPVLSPSPWRQSPKKKSDSNTDLTIRERSRAYEKKRKEDFMNKVRTAFSLNSHVNIFRVVWW